MKIINLLPKEKQAERKFSVLFTIITKLIWLSVACFVLTLLIQIGLNVYLQRYNKSVEAKIIDLKAFASLGENAKVKAEIVQNNSLIMDYKNLSQSIPKNSKVVRAFSPLVPSGVVIKQMRINPNKKSIEINGHAPTREMVIKLYNNIVENEKLFPNIDYPLENVAKPQDVNFHFTFNVSDDVLK